MFLYLLLFCSFALQHNIAVASDLLKPHWSNNQCLKCHTDMAGSELKFSGDVYRLCSSCHGGGAECVDVHPVNIVPAKKTGKTIPAGWPLNDGRITCLTCHDAIIQMSENPALQEADSAFLRGGAYARKSDFCFQCHLKQKSQKMNPHVQLDEKGDIIEKKCLFCHQTLTDSQDIDDVSFINNNPDICISCHSAKKNDHPARADHLTVLPDKIMESLSDQLNSSGIDIPVVNGRVVCGTCHNPHQKGVVKRQGAKAGAGEKYFLRLNGEGALCVACHSDKVIRKTIGADIAFKAPLLKKETVLHKPFAAQKCKACHSITAENKDRPEMRFLCFQTGCHESKIVENNFVHDESVLNDCVFCHSVHSASNKKLLKLDEIRQCSICHPLIRNSVGKAGDIEHNDFDKYINNLNLPAGQECGFCHSMTEHKQKIKNISSELCSDCHIYIREKASLNFHADFEGQLCSECHDPHAAQYRHLLKAPIERTQ